MFGIKQNRMGSLKIRGFTVAATNKRLPKGLWDKIEQLLASKKAVMPNKAEMLPASLCRTVVCSTDHR